MCSTVASPRFSSPNTTGSSSSRLKLQVTRGEQSYNYDMPGDGTPVFVPMNMGDGTYTVRPNGKGKSRPQGHAAPANRSAGGRQPSPGARFAPRSAPGHKPKNDQQKENTTWKNTNRKK